MYKPSDHLNSSTVTIFNSLPKVIMSSNTNSTFKKLLITNPLIPSVYHLCTISLLSFPFFLFSSAHNEKHFFIRMIMMPIPVLKEKYKTVLLTICELQFSDWVQQNRGKATVFNNKFLEIKSWTMNLKVANNNTLLLTLHLLCLLDEALDN